MNNEKEFKNAKLSLISTQAEVLKEIHVIWETVLNKNIKHDIIVSEIQKKIDYLTSFNNALLECRFSDFTHCTFKKNQSHQITLYLEELLKELQSQNVKVDSYIFEKINEFRIYQTRIFTLCQSYYS
ncbi:MAG TPA: hypothetical protein DHW82_07790 [Spirochaetia bacterium]|nr:MAG: hypothetical protein A2Y41_11230 [Spirochaetes bacterium GWB1_36_13]HCL56893.1 hypothetical protein [Spirochaetia bacterium]